MSITINLQPQKLEPTYNPIIIVATSSQQSQDGFLMIGDIYVNGTSVTRMKVQTNPDGFCLFDVHKHIENRISFDFNPNSFGWAPATQSQATYSVHLGEEWRPSWPFVDNFFLSGSVLGFIGTQSNEPIGFTAGDTIFIQQNTPFTFSQYNGQATIVQIIATSSPAPGYTGNHWIIETDKTYLGSTPQQGGTISLFGFGTYVDTDVQIIGTAGNPKWAFNGVRSFLEDIEWDASVYTIGGSTHSFLTNVPQNWQVGKDSRMWLAVFQENSLMDRLVIETGGFTYSLINTFTNPQLANKQPMLHVGCGPYQLLNFTSSITPAAGSSFPVLNANTKEYTVYCGDSSLNPLTEPITFKIGDYCSRYQKIQMVFLDKLGSFIPFTFNFASREQKTISKTNYQQVYGQYAPSSQNWTYNTWDRGTKSLDTIVVEQWTVTSDWVNQSTSDFLMTLMESPEVYWINEAGTTIAVNLNVVGTERKQTINDQIINYTITFVVANKNNKQRG